MFFTVLETGVQPPNEAKSKAFLIRSNWDDWGKYRTMFTLLVADEEGGLHYIGSVKIGQKGLEPDLRISENRRAPSLQSEFDELGDNYFSLGQNEDYYESLNRLSDELRARVFKGLRDCAADLEIFQTYSDEYVMNESLLRKFSASNVSGRLHRMANGDAKPTKFSFTYSFPSAGYGEAPPNLTFEVTPDSQPPTNIHVLIGRNSVGKTRCIRQIAQALLGRPSDEGGSPGTTTMGADAAGEPMDFTGLVHMSFSAFDDFRLKVIEADKLICHSVGLRKPEPDEGGAIAKSFDDLAGEFAKSLMCCRPSTRAERWRDTVQTLEDGDIFDFVDIRSLLDDDLVGDSKLEDRARHAFKKLSSGHAIVILTITLLVELVDERTLVLIDEPEGHLHPPLLASFVRCLSDLLVRRNGVAIVATHSPVVLQEVPRSCAWKLRRSSASAIAERPTVETFGENIGVLTREVFGLQVTRSGFHRLLQEATSDGSSYRDVLEKFDGQLGDEAKAIVQALIADRAHRGLNA